VRDALTVIFHGRRESNACQTYVTRGSIAAGTTVAGQRVLRVRATATSRTPEDRARPSSSSTSGQATAAPLSDALVGADVVIDV